MAILKGTSKTRFPPFTDSSVGSGQVLRQAQDALFQAIRGLNDSNWESQFVESGTQNIPGFSTFDQSYSQIKQPSRRQVITKRTQATVFVKKKMFSTLKDNFDVRFMDSDEKLFIKAVKLLFERKAHELSFYENLTNIQSIFDDSGFLKIDKLNEQFFSSIGALIQSLFGPNALFDAGSDGSQVLVSTIIDQNPILSNVVTSYLANLLDDLIKVQDVNRRARGSHFTNWVVDYRNPDNSGVGPGVGVLELNLVQRIQTNVSNQPGNGSATFSFQDPYKISLITDADVEIALGEAIAQSGIAGGSFRTLGLKLLDLAEGFDARLNKLRRDARQSEINFEYDYSTGSVLGNIVELNVSFDKFSIGLYIGEPGKSSIGSEAFNLEQAALAKEIISYLEQYRLLDERNISIFKTLNEQFSGIRQRMRNEFVGHSIVQQFDAVHIFVNSKTRDVTPESEKAISSNIFLDGLNVQGDALDVFSIKAEWEATAPNLPFSFYLAIRDRSQWRSDGVQVFSGVVDSISTNYNASDGSFSLNISCKDNMEFLKAGRFNRLPSVAQPGGLINDPLTPFKLDIDPSSGLVKGDPKLSDQNIKRLDYLRYDDGILTGKRVTEQNIAQDKVAGGLVTVFQHSPGLFYRWKDGIISETLSVNTRKPLNGKGPTLSEIIDVYGVTTFSNPFSGLDAADVISIMITGRPYNYATFIKHATDTGTFSIDSSNQEKFYFNYLFDFFERGPIIPGNFVPAKSSLISAEVAAAAFREKQKIDGKAKSRYRLEQEIAATSDSIATMMFDGTLTINNEAFEGPPSETQVSGESKLTELAKLKERRQQLQQELDQALLNAQDNIGAAGSEAISASLTVVGNEVLLNFDEAEFTQNNKLLEYKIKRKPEDVRYNLDNNYFVVSDQYDTDVDIQAFAKSLKEGGPDLFDSEFQSAFDICQSAASAIGFEFFADSQGNIVFRPPEYNKTPLSLLMKLMAMKGGEGANYLPPFLANLFESRTNLMKDEILNIELEILEQVLLLGNALNVSSAGVAISNFKLFLYSDDTINWYLDVEKMMEDLAQGMANEGKPAVKKNLFSPEQQVLLIESQETNAESQAEIRSRSATQLLNVRNALFNRRGRSDKVKKYSESVVKELKEEIDTYSVGKSTSASTNRLKAANLIAQLLSRRQTLIKAYSKTIETAGQFGGTEQKSSFFSLPTLNDITSQINNFFSASPSIPAMPKFMERLVENDLANADGWRSGKRFIINDDVIISMQLDAKTPDYTTIEVTGNRDFISGNEQGSLGGIPKVLWAGATDFDMWRQYGYRQSKPIFRADFVNPETQCAPYAVFKLIEQRATIHSGSITIAGNEHYQVGDVVYVNNRSMLYYVSNVSHDFEFDSGNFSTTLSLSHGRALGEYIPTPLDVIGKGLLSNNRQSFGNIAISRSASGSGYAVHMDTFFVPNYNSLSLENISSAKSDFLSSDQNKNIASFIVKKAGVKINSNQESNSRIEIRTFYLKSKSPNELNPTFVKAKQLSQWVYLLLSSEINKVIENDSSNKIEVSKLFPVSPISVNKDTELTEREEKLLRFPSGRAWSGINQYLNSDGVELPLNAIDVFFVSEKSSFGDQQNIELNDFPLFVSLE
jgi:hypothetical protein